jgi:hypothetical protein
VPPPKSYWFCAEVAELADARDLKSLAPKERTGSIPVFGTSYKRVSEKSEPFFILIFVTFFVTRVVNAIVTMFI